jgi:hypothetical protein
VRVGLVQVRDDPRLFDFPSGRASGNCSRPRSGGRGSTSGRLAGARARRRWGRVRAARSVVERSPLLSELVETVTEDEIAFRNGTALTAFPCTSRGARGWPISTLLMDEVAYFFSETEGRRWPTASSPRSCPRRLSSGTACASIVASTPFGSSGLFTDLFQRASSGELPDAVAELRQRRSAIRTAASSPRCRLRRRLRPLGRAERQGRRGAPVRNIRPERSGLFKSASARATAQNDKRQRRGPNGNGVALKTLRPSPRKRGGGGTETNPQLLGLTGPGRKDRAARAGCSGSLHRTPCLRGRAQTHLRAPVGRQPYLQPRWYERAPSRPRCQGPSSLPQ